jgi:hypothetical protein
MILTLIILILLLSVSIYGNYNLLRKSEVLEDLVNEQATKLSDIRTKVLDIEAELISIDIKGSFESDDEIGFVFKEVRNLSKDLTTTVQQNYDI